MFPSGWSVWGLLLTAHLSACSLVTVQHGSQVICSQGLSECTTKICTPCDNNSVEITDLVPQVKLCCSGDTCKLCLLVHAEVNLDKANDDESYSGQEGGNGTEETKYGEAETGSVTICYKMPEILPTCTTVEFTSNLSQQGTSQISLTIGNAVISFGSLVLVFSPNTEIFKKVTVPSFDNVCSSDIARLIPYCEAPLLNVTINTTHVELRLSDEKTSNVCIQYEVDGSCKVRVGNDGIPLCFRFVDLGQKTYPTVLSHPLHMLSDERSIKALQTNVWRNLTVSVDWGFMNTNSTMLMWNMLSPCRVEGEVWACERTAGPGDCRELKGFRNLLKKDQWSQNNERIWEISDVFEEINLDRFPCVMVKIKGMEYEMGPFCYHNINRWRWSLFAVAVILLLCLTLVITFCLRDFVKKSVWSCHHGGFIKIVKKGHVLVLSPPDSDGVVSSAVCSLGSLLYSNGFSVTVDQWSRRDQLASGPLPWSHSQLLSMNSQCDRVVLVLTPKAVERAAKWNGQQDNNLHEESSPYADVFTASLFAIKAYKNQGRASERFVLVIFDSQWTEAKICELLKLPEILRELPLFHYPSQTKALFSELCVGRTQRQPGTTRWAFFGRISKDQPNSLNSETCEPEKKPLQPLLKEHY